MKKIIDIFISTFFFLVVVIGITLFFVYVELKSLDFTIIGIGIALIIVQLLFGIYVISSSRENNAKLSWVWAVTGIPILGILIYFIFGRQYRERVSANKWKKINYKSIGLIEDDSFLKKERKRAVLLKEDKAIFNFIYNSIGKPIYINSKIEPLRYGGEIFAEIIEELEKAKDFIHIEYFIVKNDSCYQALKDVLVKKAKEGVEIRFIGDWFGTQCNVTKQNIKKDFIKNGIKYKSFNPFKFPFFDTTNNYRTHRKLIIIDNKVGFMGGNNFGLEYTNRSEKFGHMTDLHFKIQGDILRSLQATFVYDWEYVSNEKLTDRKYTVFKHDIESDDNICQLIPQGPDLQESIMNQILTKLIMEAQQRVWITTPYFIPTDELMTALIVARKSGIDVRIITPAYPDSKRFIWHMNRSYYRQLISHGIKVYEHQSFIHSKLVIIDEDISLIGTANFDLRSLYQSYEAQLLVKGKITNNLSKIYEDYIRNSIAIDSNVQIPNGRLWRFYIAIMRIIEPIF